MNGYFSAKKIALTAIMASTLTVFKFILAPIANIELVSLLIALYAVIFGWISIFAVIIFVFVEMVIWGTGIWVIYYFIYWNVLAGVFLFYGKLHIKNILLITLTIAVLTLFFGILTSFFDIAYSGFSDFWRRYNIYYLRGTWFYFKHILSNILIFLFLFKPLKAVLLRFKPLTE